MCGTAYLLAVWGAVTLLASKQCYRDCDRLTIRNIAVFNHVSYNNDGLNIDSCRDVTITGCRVDSDDDGIVLKSLSRKP